MRRTRCAARGSSSPWRPSVLGRVPVEHPVLAGAGWRLAAIRVLRAAQVGARDEVGRRPRAGLEVRARVSKPLLSVTTGLDTGSGPWSASPLLVEFVGERFVVDELLARSPAGQGGSGELLVGHVGGNSSAIAQTQPRIKVADSRSARGRMGELGRTRTAVRHPGTSSTRSRRPAQARPACGRVHRAQPFRRGLALATCCDCRPCSADPAR